MTPATLEALMAARVARRAVVLATRLRDGAQHVLPDPNAPRHLVEAAAAALDRDDSSVVETAGETWFLAVHAPPHRLLIIGAVHTAQALAPLATAAGLAVTIIDPRSGFATEERFPGTHMEIAWPDEALAMAVADGRTAVVALSHDPKLDDPALDRALRSPAFYIGALGSRRSHAARLERLAEHGHTPETLARIRGPIGLPIGAVTAPEIAISIVAEIVATRRKATLNERRP